MPWILLKLSRCSLCHASHSEAFGPVSDVGAKVVRQCRDSLLAKWKCLGHEKRCLSEVGMTMDKMTTPSRHWVAIPYSMPAMVKCFGPVSDIGTKVVRRWTSTTLLSRLVHTKEAKLIWAWEHPTEWRKADSKTTANGYQDKGPSSICTRYYVCCPYCNCYCNCNLPYKYLRGSSRRGHSRSLGPLVLRWILWWVTAGHQHLCKVFLGVV